MHFVLAIVPMNSSKTYQATDKQRIESVPVKRKLGVVVEV